MQLIQQAFQQKKGLYLFTIVLGLLVTSSTFSSRNAPPIDPNYYYRLTNEALGPKRSLDTYSNANNQPFMGQTGNYSGQFWKFTPLGNNYYRMTNSFLKEGRSLDTYSNLPNLPFMGQTGNYSGQYWYLTPVDNTNTYYWLRNSFIKDVRALSAGTWDNGKLMMDSTTNYPPQKWKLTKLQRIPGK